MIGYKLREENSMSGIHILVGDSYGVYVPQVFAESFDPEKWGADPADIETISKGPGPENEWYWEAWNSILNKAEFIDNEGHTWRLTQDGDLFSYCEELMSDEERENFFGP
jgi:hypothetical protein